MFICLEGIDGSGKTSAARAVIRGLRDRGVDAVAVRKARVHADHPEVAARFAAIGRTGWRPGADNEVRALGDLPWVLYNATYYAALAANLVEPALAAGRTVVVDGWFYKFALRAAAVGSLSLPAVLSAFAQIRAPDKVFLLDEPPSVAAARLTSFTDNETGNGSTPASDDRTAFVEFQTDIRDRLLSIAGEQRWTVIDGTAGTTDVMTQVITGLAAVPAPTR